MKINLPATVRAASGADFVVTSVGGVPGVINGLTGATVGTYATYSAAVNAALATTTNAITIWLDPQYVDDETGTVTISRKNVTIYSGMHIGEESGDTWFTGGPPAFQKIVISSASMEIRNIRLQGINMRELNFSTGSSYNMSNIVVDNCGFRPTTATSTSGIHFSGSMMVNYVEFNDCWEYDLCTTGGILFEITTEVGCGQFFFNRFHYKAGVNSCEMFVCGAGSRIDQATVFDQLDHVNISRTGHSIFHFKAGSKQLNVRVVNSRFEEHLSANVFLIDVGKSGTATHRRWIDFSHNTCSLGDNNTQVLTFITNNAVLADYAGYSQNFLMRHQNKFISDSTSTGSFTVGTTGATTRFIWDLGYTYYQNTVEVNAVQTKG
jgi:hypothetical protein